MNADSDTRQYAISVRQPWAWAVVHAGKDVENRGPHAPRLFQAAVGQRVYIHASKSMTTAEWLEAKSFMAKLGVACPSSSDLMYGGIIGSVLVVDIITRHPSPWFLGPGARRVRALPGPAMIKIAITVEAYEAITAALPLGSVAVEPYYEQGLRVVWLEEVWVNRLSAMRGPEESYSEAILRLIAMEDAQRP